MNQSTKRTLMKMGQQAFGVIGTIGLVVLGIFLIRWLIQVFVKLVQKASMKMWGFELESDLIFFVCFFSSILLGLVFFGIKHWYGEIRRDVDRQLAEEARLREIEEREQRLQTLRAQAETRAAALPQFKPNLEVKVRLPKAKALEVLPEVPKKTGGRWAWLQKKEK